MANILCCWELGAGLGHLRRLAPIAAYLRGTGHDVNLASRVLRPVGALFGDNLNRVYQAPFQFGPSSEAIQPTVGLAHVLNNVGFGSEDGLLALVRAWHVLFDASKIDVVIADHSPTAVLAALTAGIRCITVGTGFELPLFDQPLPSFRPHLNRTAAASLEQCERTICSNINALLARYEKPPLRFACDLYASAVGNFLITFPEFDHYGERPNFTYYGIPIEACGAAPVWPSAPGPRFYAYLKPGPRLAEFFVGINASSVSMLVYHSNLPRHIVDQASSDKIHFTSEILDLNAVANTADFALLNATHTTMAQFLLAGVPCVLAPLHPEQRLVAEAVRAFGAGVIVDYGNEKQMLAGVRQVLSDKRYRGAAAAFAARHARDDQVALDSRMHNEIERLIRAC
jgi:hypothetical protein